MHRIHKIFTTVIVSGALLLTACGTDNVNISNPETISNDNMITKTAIVEQTYTPTLPTDVEQSSIFVQKIDGISPDFIRGMDISSLLVEEACGVKYYDANGDEQDLFKILADAGINCVRIRVWVDPFDSEGHGYGGGNCTAETAAEIGARAAAYGITTCVDFHYSDFWADPGKQMCPKAWEGMTLSEEKEALYEYTIDSMHTIMNAGANVIMVQIGNEINNGMAGRTSFGNVSELLNEGSKAIRAISEEYSRDIKVAVHYTNIDDIKGIDQIAERLFKYNVDYDVFGISYYPYWHGSFENMQKTLTNIHNKYGVETCVMETAYLYTTEDGDGSGNSVSADGELELYPIGVQGQANCVRDVMAYAQAAGALGVMYWEGAWIPVNPESGTRSSMWEEYGSGWASSYAAEYDPKDAGAFYGGCSWENQAFFDFGGHVLDSINVFKYVDHGVVGDKLEIVKLSDVSLVFSPGSELILPETVGAVYNDSACQDGLAITWNEEDLAAIDMNQSGEYEIRGTVSGLDGDIDITATVSVCNVNLVQNPSFEDADTSMWTVRANNGVDPTDIQNKTADAHTGDMSFHFWSQSDMDFNLEQTFVVEQDGVYDMSAYMQGGDFNPDAEIYFYVQVGDAIYTSDPVKPDGWAKWKNPRIDDIHIIAGDEVTVGAYVRCDALAWATIDDISLTLK